MSEDAGLEHEGFVKVLNFNIKHVEVSEYVSRFTGVRVFFLTYETPLVNTYMVLPTREETDEGLPHTLEHLIFLGSENYPFRGTMDMVSCMCLSSGTNAWTSTDHTAYTLSTAGLEGTLQMLPIYLDHILRPLLTEIGFMTDIHHVTSDGSSSGVAYCEMKGRENNMDELMYFENLDKLYPGDSGYKRNTGGKLSGLRSTNIQRVREFHKKYYKWNNLSIVMCGNVTDEKRVLSLIQEQERLMNPGLNHVMTKEKGRNAKRKKDEKDVKRQEPWRERMEVWNDRKHVQELKENTTSTIEFPAEEEESGYLTMSWRGPSWEEFDLVRSISIVGSYLVDSTASPLEKALIHTENPVGSCVDFSMELFREIYFQLVVKDVPIKKGKERDNKMKEAEERLKRGIQEVQEGELDMERMKMLIRRGNLNYLRQIETCAHETLIDNVIGYIIYGKEEEQLKKLLKDNEIVESLLKKEESYWKDILRRYFIERPAVVVKCYPSVERGKQIEKEEKELMKAQMDKYGKEQLDKNKKAVEDELNKNKNGPPKEIITKFKQCNTDLIQLPKYPMYRNFKHNATTNTNNNNNSYSNNSKVEEWKEGDKRRRQEELNERRKELEKIKYPVQVNNIPSDFVRMYVLFSTCKANLDKREKKLLFLLCVLLFESKVEFEGKLLESEDFIAKLMENTTSYGCNLGLSSSAALPDSYSDLLTMSFTCPTDKYYQVLEIFKNVIKNVKYDEEIMVKHIKSLTNSFSKKKRSAKTLLKQLSNYLRSKEESVRHLCSLGQQDELFKKILAEEDGPKKVKEELVKLHKKVFDVGQMTVHITGDLGKLKGDWLKFWVELGEERREDVKRKRNEGNGQKQEQKQEQQVLNEYFGLKYGRDKEIKKTSGVLSSMASTDVSHIWMAIPAPYGFNHEDYFPILTCCEYLTMTEGPMYRAVRGGGYAYHHRVSYTPSQGEIHMEVREATDLIEAVRVIRGCLLKCLESDYHMEEDLKAAKSSLIYRILSNEESLADYSQETFTSALRMTDVDFNKYSVGQIQKLEVDRIRGILDKYFRGLLNFEGPPKILSVITSKTEEEAIAKGLEKVEYLNVEKLDSKALLTLLSSSAD